MVCACCSCARPSKKERALPISEVSSTIAPCAAPAPNVVVPSADAAPDRPPSSSVWMELVLWGSLLVFSEVRNTPALCPTHGSMSLLKLSLCPSLESSAWARLPYGSLRCVSFFAAVDASPPAPPLGLIATLAYSGADAGTRLAGSPLEPDEPHPASASAPSR